MTRSNQELMTLAGADDWEVAPCVDRLGHVTSWDICLPQKPGACGVAVVASVYSGEAVARAILAAIQKVAIEKRRAALTQMMQLDEELGLNEPDDARAAQEDRNG